MLGNFPQFICKQHCLFPLCTSVPFHFCQELLPYHIRAKTGSKTTSVPSKAISHITRNRQSQRPTAFLATSFSPHVEFMSPGPRLHGIRCPTNHYNSTNFMLEAVHLYPARRRSSFQVPYILEFKMSLR